MSSLSPAVVSLTVGVVKTENRPMPCVLEEVLCQHSDGAEWAKSIAEKVKAMLDEMHLVHYNKTRYGNFALERIIDYGKGI